MVYKESNFIGLKREVTDELKNAAVTFANSDGETELSFEYVRNEFELRFS